MYSKVKICLENTLPLHNHPIPLRTLSLNGCAVKLACNGLPRWGQCKNRASRPSQGTVNGGAISKCPRCRWDIKHNQPTNQNLNGCKCNVSSSFEYCKF